VPRFPVPPSAVRGDDIRLTGRDVRHIVTVLRLGVGDVLDVLLPDGTRASAEIVSVAPGEVRARVFRREGPVPEPRAKVVLAQAIPKGQRMDLIVRAASELGVAELVPLVTKRTVVRLEAERRMQRVQRWQRIAAEAQKQCERAKPLRVRDVVPLGELLAEVRGAERAVAFASEGQEKLEAALGPVEQGPVLLVVGPEGGFDRQELEDLRRAGAALASLGPRTLRSETAAIVACALTMHHLGEM